MMCPGAWPARPAGQVPDGGSGVGRRCRHNPCRAALRVHGSSQQLTSPKDPPPNRRSWVRELYSNVQRRMSTASKLPALLSIAWGSPDCSPCPPSTSHRLPLVPRSHGLAVPGAPCPPLPSAVSCKRRPAATVAASVAAPPSDAAKDSSRPRASSSLPACAACTSRSRPAENCGHASQVDGVALVSVGDEAQPALPIKKQTARTPPPNPHPSPAHLQCGRLRQGLEHCLRTLHPGSQLRLLQQEKVDGLQPAGLRLADAQRNLRRRSGQLGSVTHARCSCHAVQAHVVGALLVACARLFRLRPPTAAASWGGYPRSPQLMAGKAMLAALCSLASSRAQRYALASSGSESAGTV